jgi:hypothetical protein
MMLPNETVPRSNSSSSSESTSTTTQRSLSTTSSSSLFFSSKQHRFTQRATAMMELLGNTASASEGSLTANIPTKVSQIILSSRACLQPDAKRAESVTHGLQATLSLIQLLLLLSLFFQDKSCSLNKEPLCKLLFISDLIYKSMLLLSWGAAEIFKEEEGSGSESPASVSMCRFFNLPQLKAPKKTSDTLEAHSETSSGLNLV